MKEKDKIEARVVRQGVDTLPKLLKERKKRVPEKIAMRKRLYGVWNEYSWQDVYLHVKYAALGLFALGLKKGDKAIIIGDNDPEWFWAEWAVQSLGGVACGVYIDCSADEVKYYLENSESVFAFARDQEQVDKILDIKEKVHEVKKIIYWDDRGLWFYDDPAIMEFRELESLGSEYEKTNKEVFEKSIDQGKGNDTAIFCYTSGTTGTPKAAMVSHANLMSSFQRLNTVNPFVSTDNYISYISPAWITEQILGITGGVTVPFVINFPEKPETVQTDIRDIGPDIIFYAARLWETLASTIQAKIIDSSPLKRLSYNLASKINQKRLTKREKGEAIGLFVSFFHRLSDFMVFRPLRDRLGLTKIKVGYTAGAAISPDMMRLFHAIGVNIKNLYGSTETGLISVHRDKDVRYETVGIPFDGCEIKISKQSEILVKSDMVFKGYYKNPVATQKVLEGGYFRTGDAGYFDKGHLIYEDRLDELIELYEGHKFSPQFIEIRLRFSPYIGDVIVFGGREKPFVSAIIIMDFENMGKWAENLKIPFTTYMDLSQKKDVRNLLKRIISDVNTFLPEYSRIKAFVNLHKEFDADEAELTRTRKLKRKPIEDKYKEILANIYRKEDKINVISQVAYRDGRIGSVSTELVINYL